MSTRSGRLIGDVRRRAGLSQTELARRAGITQSVLSAYENGHREPGAEAFLRLIRAARFRFDIVSTRIDLERAGRQLIDVLGLADRLPKADRGDLRYPRLG